MNQPETFWLRKIIFLTIVILTVVSSVARVQPAFAQVTPANFDEIDAYVSAKMEELGIPGAALVIDCAGRSNRSPEGVWSGRWVRSPGHPADAVLHRFDWQIYYRTRHHAIGRSRQDQIGCAGSNLLAVVSSRRCECIPNHYCAPASKHDEWNSQVHRAGANSKY